MTQFIFYTVEDSDIGKFTIDGVENIDEAVDALNFELSCHDEWFAELSEKHGVYSVNLFLKGYPMYKMCVLELENNVLKKEKNNGQPV